MIQIVENKIVDGVASRRPGRREFFALALKLIQFAGAPGYGDRYIVFWEMADGTVAGGILFRKVSVGIPVAEPDRLQLTCTATVVTLLITSCESS